MIKRIFYNTTLTVAFVFLAVCLSAQEKTIVRATVDRSKILIGEPISLTLQADIPNNEPIRFFQLDSLPHFEFLARQKIDTSNTSSGTVLSQVIQITSFDSGHWVIPAFVLGEMVSDTIPVDVGFSSFDPEQAYHDIKDIIEVDAEKKKEDKTWWYVAGGILLLIALLVILLRKKKRPIVKAPPPPVDPYREAMGQLEKLQKQKPATKQYYSTLTDIFRVYILERKGIQSLQETTNDLVVQLRSLHLPAEPFDRLAAALRLGDFVKFAKYEPSGEDDKNNFETIKGVIEQIEQMHRSVVATTQDNLQRK